MLDTIPLQKKRLQHTQKVVARHAGQTSSANTVVNLTRNQKILVAIGVVIVVATSGVAILRFSRASTSSTTPPTNLSDIASFVEQLAPTTSNLTSPIKGYSEFRYVPTTTQPINKVVYYIDGQRISTTSTSPYALKLDTARLSDGSHTLTAVAFNTGGLPIAAVRKTIVIQNGSGLLQQAKNIITLPWNRLFNL